MASIGVPLARFGRDLGDYLKSLESPWRDFWAMPVSTPGRGRNAQVWEITPKHKFSGFEGPTPGNRTFKCLPDFMLVICLLTLTYHVPNLLLPLVLGAKDGQELYAIVTHASIVHMTHTRGAPSSNLKSKMIGCWLIYGPIYKKAGSTVWSPGLILDSL